MTEKRLPAIFFMRLVLSSINLLLLGIFAIANVHAQKPTASPLARFLVEIGPFERTDTPVGVAIQGLPLDLANTSLVLFELQNGEKRKVESQLDLGYLPFLYWILDGRSAPNTTRTFELYSMEEQAVTADFGVVLQDNQKAIEIKRKGKAALAYHYAVTPPPAGVSERYERAGYIHPLRSPSGAVLTRIQPADHYHHYGVMNPWTHTEYKGREIDFWNLNKGQGTIKVKEKPVFSSGKLFGELQSEQWHVVFADSTRSAEEAALREQLQVRVWDNGQPLDPILIDLTSRYHCATDSPLTLLQYRYQGLVFRSRAEWGDKNVRILTSEGKTKKNGNGTRGRWCLAEGPTENGTAGLLIMSYPSNYDFPEMLRIWPEGTQGGKENVFINYNPTMAQQWTLSPQKSYTLKYRLVTYEGRMPTEKAEKLWHEFAHPPKVSVKLP